MDGDNLNLSDVLHDNWMFEDDFPMQRQNATFESNSQIPSRVPSNKHFQKVVNTEIDQLPFKQESGKRVFITPEYRPDPSKVPEQAPSFSSLFEPTPSLPISVKQEFLPPAQSSILPFTKQQPKPPKSKKNSRAHEQSLFLAEAPHLPHLESIKHNSVPKINVRNPSIGFPRSSGRKTFFNLKRESHEGPNIPSLHQQAQMQIAYMHQLNNYEQMNAAQPASGFGPPTPMDSLPSFYATPPPAKVLTSSSTDFKSMPTSSHSSFGSNLNLKYTDVLRNRSKHSSMEVDFELPGNFLEGNHDSRERLLLDVEEPATMSLAEPLANIGHADMARGLEGHHHQKLQPEGEGDANGKANEKLVENIPNAGGDELLDGIDPGLRKMEGLHADGSREEAENRDGIEGESGGNASGGNSGEGYDERGDNESNDGGRRGGVVNEASSSSGGGDSCGVATTTGPAPKGSSTKSSLQELLQQPIRSTQGSLPFYPSVPYVFSPSVKVVADPSNMQFYQAHAAPHHMRNTPPPGSFVQPYAVNVRPHEEETRQIMNLDNQQTTNSSPNSSWNAHQQYAQMTTMNAYQQRGPPIYPPPQMPHNGAPQVAPTSNPYYPAHHHHPHHMPQAPMMPPGMHGQQQPPQQPYFSAQSPLNAMIPVGTPPMPFGSAPPMAQMTNGNGSIFNFSKPRATTETSSASSSSTSTHHRKKKQPDLSSPRYSDDIDGSVFPDMSDFPLLDVVQSKAKKDAGRKPCRPHLCEQSRMLISRVCHFHREFAKRLNPRHPLTNSPMSKPDQWTSTLMGISLATVRKCMDMASEEEVFTRCTDKNLVNLSPAERGERDEMLAKLSTVFEGEKSLGAGTAGLTIAEYSPRRQYSNSQARAISPADEKSKSSINDTDSPCGEPTTLPNLDDQSNSKGGVPTPSSLTNVEFEVGNDIGTMMGADIRDMDDAKEDVPKHRGRPKKNNGNVRASSKPKEMRGASEVSDDKDETEKKTEDENETTPESELVKKDNEGNELEREDDAASSEGTNRSETATPELNTNAASVGKGKGRGRKKRNSTIDKDDVISVAKKKKVQNGENGSVDDENGEHKMLTRTRSRQP